MPIGTRLLGSEMPFFRDSIYFGAKSVSIRLLIDDVRKTMVGIEVNNNSTQDVKIVIENGKVIIVRANTLNSIVPFIIEDERVIEKHIDGVIESRPISAVYPWFN